MYVVQEPACSINLVQNTVQCQAFVETVMNNP